MRDSISHTYVRPLMALPKTSGKMEAKYWRKIKIFAQQKFKAS